MKCWAKSTFSSTATTTVRPTATSKRRCRAGSSRSRAPRTSAASPTPTARTAPAPSAARLRRHLRRRLRRCGRGPAQRGAVRPHALRRPRHHALPFPDCDRPPPAVVAAFFQAAEAPLAAGGAVAVHCRAGAGPNRHAHRAAPDAEPRPHGAGGHGLAARHAARVGHLNASDSLLQLRGRGTNGARS